MIQVSKPSAASRTRNDTGFNSFSPVVGGFELLESHTTAKTNNGQFSLQFTGAKFWTSFDEEHKKLARRSSKKY